jgi:hypothetical protein
MNLKSAKHKVALFLFHRDLRLEDKMKNIEKMFSLPMKTFLFTHLVDYTFCEC